MQTNSLDRKTGAPVLFFSSAFLLPGAPGGSFSATALGMLKLQLAQVSPCDRPYRHCALLSRFSSTAGSKELFSVVRLSGSVSESTVVDAPEKSVGRVRLVSVLRRGGDVGRSGVDSKDVSWTWVLRDSEEEQAFKEGEGGLHQAHSKGRTCVHSTDLGPWASQKCVRASYKEVSCAASSLRQAHHAPPSV